MTGDRVPFDLVAYETRSRRGPCFVCAHLAAADPADVHHEVYADERCVAFLNRYPTLLGYTLVAPRRHVVDVTGDRPLFRHLTDVVYERQQFHALMAEHGVLDVPPAEQAALARRIAGAVSVQRTGGRGV